MNYRDYLQLGWPVFPVAGPIYAKNKDDYKTWKKPLVNWKTYQDKLPLETEIIAWEKKWPGAWVGCVTGPFSKLFVVDVDGEKGIKSFDDLKYPLPFTRIAKTRRGFHIFFQWNDDLEHYVTNTSDVFPGIDVRGKGGFVIVPSDQEDRGWRQTCDPAPMPKEWLNIVRPINGNGVKVPITQNEIMEGNRHENFLSLAGKLKHSPLTWPEIEMLLTSFAEKFNFGKDASDLVRDAEKRYGPTKAVVPFEAESIASLLSKNIPPLEWLIDGLWVDHAKGLIVGEANLGKTFVALDMAISVATGLPCLGKFMPRQKAPALLIEEEGNTINLQRRIQMMKRGRGLKPSDLENFHHFSFHAPKVPKDTDNIIAMINKVGAKLVIFDALVRFHDEDENSSSAMRSVLESFTRMSRETDAAIILLHHMSKPSKEGKTYWQRVRGTSDFVAWRDCMVGLEGEAGSDTALCHFQFRDAEMPAPIQIKRTTDEMTGAITLSVINIQETDEFIEKKDSMLKFMEKHEPCSQEQVVNGIKGNRPAKIKFFKLMASQNIIEKNGYNWVRKPVPNI